MPKFKSKLESIIITLGDVKRTFERGIDVEKAYLSVGFCMADFVALFDKKIKDKNIKQRLKDIINDISNKPFSKLSRKQKDLLNLISIPAWDLIMASSGGHKAITNISGLSFISKKQYPNGQVGLIHDLQYEIAKRMEKE